MHTVDTSTGAGKPCKSLAENVLLLMMNECAYTRGLIDEGTKAVIHNNLVAQVTNIALLNNSTA